ncbi:MAG TPA: TIGR00730 family Rossman fold protein [Flavobacteriaceae bacterium]|nr:TIGR00730 family Rossman fold protein [Flavobacteriaceae bacterium]
MGNQLRSVAVFCGSSPGNDPKIIEEAYNLGKILGQKKIKLIYGGSKLGLMGELARGVLENNGKVTGVIPRFLRIKEVVHTGLTELVLVETMHERKLKMHEISDGIIVLPGGFGTMEEFFEMITWSQLGLHQKPIGMLNSTGFYDDLLSFFQTMVKKEFLQADNRDLLLVSNDIDDLLHLMENYEATVKPKWMNKSQT